MKKFIMSIVSLVLAGSMAFGLAACGGKTNPDDDNKDDTNNNLPSDGTEGGNNGGEEGGGNTVGNAEDWAKLFDDLGKLDSFTLTTTYTEGMGIKYRGEYVTEETTFDNIMLQMMVPELLGEIGLDEENPATREEISIDKYDFKTGKVEEESYFDAEKKDYSVVNGTTINTYSWSQTYRDDVETAYISNHDYVGYGSNEQALAVFRAQNDPFKYMLAEEYSGVGEYANVKGNVYELYEIFEFDETTGIYSATVAAPDTYYPEGTEVKVELKIENGTIVEYNYRLAAGGELADALADMIDDEDVLALLEGFTYEMIEGSTMKLTDVNSTVITVPSGLEEQAEYSYTSYVISGEDAYKAMFSDLAGNEGTVNLSINNYNEGVSTSTTAGYNAELNLLKITKTSDDYQNDIHDKEVKLYWATDDGMKIYTAEYDDEHGYLEFKGWSDNVETQAISGDKTAALMALLPAEMQLYFNINGKPMAEQFSLFELKGYDSYEAKVTVGGNELSIGLGYGYEEKTGEVFLNGYSVRVSDSYTYVSLSTGYLIDSSEGLPEVEGTPVTESEWKAIVEPWYNLKNVTIVSNYGDKVVVDIAADGKSGKIYNLSDYEGGCRYVEFECSNDEVYTVTIYTCQYSGWDDEKHEDIFTWYKEQFNVEYDNLLNEVYPYVLSYFNEDLGNSWENVTYNPMTKGYDWNNGEHHTILVGEGKITFGSSTLCNKGTTVAGDIPADIIANAIER